MTRWSTEITKETVQDRVKRGDYSDYKSGDGPGGQVTGVEIVDSKTTPQKDIETVRAELKVMEGLCSNRSDDASVWAAQEALNRLEAALCKTNQ